MEWLKRFWNAFKDIAIVFSFAVNFVTVVLLLLIGVPAIQAVFALKTGLVEPLLNDLDVAFVGLSEATIDTTVQIDEHIPIQFDLLLDQQLPIGFQLPIEQNTVVVLQQPVPLSVPTQFNLPGGGGVINGYVSLSLPTGLRLPVHLSMVVPVSQTIPVRMNIPQPDHPYPDDSAGAHQTRRGGVGPGGRGTACRLSPVEAADREPARRDRVSVIDPFAVSRYNPLSF